MTDYGRAFRIARAAVGMRQRELADACGLHPSHVSLIESGKRQPSVTTLHAVARALRIPTDVMVAIAEPGTANDVIAVAVFVALTQVEGGARRQRRSLSGII